MVSVRLITTGQRSSVYNEAEGEHTLYFDWSTCTVFETVESNLMHPTEGKLTTLAITTLATNKYKKRRNSPCKVGNIQSDICNK